MARRRFALRVLVPLCFAVVAIIGNGAVVAFQIVQRALRAEAHRTMVQVEDEVHTFLDVTHSLMSARVATSMDLLKSRLEALGPASQGAEVAVGETEAPDLRFGGRGLANRFEVVDAVTHSAGGTATVFSRRGPDFVRISTNVRKQDGSRAVGTVLDPNGPAIAAIRRGKAYYGVVDILGFPYITGYEPIRSAGGEVVGVAYVGYRVDSLKALGESVQRIRLLDRGYLALLDANGRPVFHSGTVQPPQLEAHRKASFDMPGWTFRQGPYQRWRFVMVAGYPEQDVRSRAWAFFRWVMVGAVLLTLALLAGLYWILQTRMMAPIRDLEAALGEGEAGRSMDTSSDDELGHLAEAVNRANDRTRRLAGASHAVLEGCPGAEAHLRRTLEGLPEGLQGDASPESD